MKKYARVSFFKINNVTDSVEMASMLKIHISDWKEKVPDGSSTKRGNEKAIVKRTMKTHAKLITGRAEDLFIGISFRLNMFDFSRPMDDWING